MNKYISIIIAGLITLIISCNKKDDIPPVITLNGPDSVTHVLNEPYTDQGATAIDEEDGNISSNIYIDSNVDVDKVGEYQVIYKAVDEAGNEAQEVSRYVQVYNQGRDFAGYYLLTENQTCPNQETCEYLVTINSDSIVNYRLLIGSMACDYGQEVYADVYDTAIIMPYQLFQDSISSMDIQGDGIINDSIIYINYKKSTDTTTSLWNAEFIRQ